MEWLSINHTDSGTIGSFVGQLKRPLRVVHSSRIADLPLYAKGASLGEGVFLSKV
jgi:hypothetical protein